MKLFKNKKKRKGFTLVELVVVVAIIAILAFIAAPKFASMTENAKIATFESNHDVVKTAISLYMAENQGDLSNVDDFKTPTGGDKYTLPESFTKFIDGGTDLRNKPDGATYTWDKDKKVLTSTLTGLSNNALKDIDNSKRPGIKNSAGAYELTFNPTVEDTNTPNPSPSP